MSKDKSNRQRILKTFYAPYPREVCRQILWEQRDRLREEGFEVIFSPAVLIVRYAVPLFGRLPLVFPGQVEVSLHRVSDKATEIAVVEYSNTTEWVWLVSSLIGMFLIAGFLSYDSPHDFIILLPCLFLPYPISAARTLSQQLSERHIKRKFVEQVVAMLGNEEKYRYFEPESRT